MDTSSTESSRLFDDEDEELQTCKPNKLNTNFDITECSPDGNFLRYSQLLGEKSYIKVFKGQDTERGCEIAWKIVYLDGLPPEKIQAILGELQRCHQLVHANLIDFIHAWINLENKTLAVINELIVGNPLDCILQRMGRPKLCLIKNWCRGILKGLKYLHAQQPPIVHKHLKP